MAHQNTARALLLRLGMHDFNATGTIPYLFMAPAQVDADMAAIILMVEAMQKTMNQMGARLAVTGDLDVPTVLQLKKLVGPDWLSMKWFEIVRKVLRAKDTGVRLERSLQAPASWSVPDEIADKDDLSGLDDILPQLSRMEKIAAAVAGGGLLLYLWHRARSRR